ncbi:hypothetical protein DFH11DRAFT_1069847 [Phellopilus nigrolimitatus]|nr:hypothetical protein DFH11DRAFT_1069847 [Phellopilus nigrolimitatus]
METKFRKTVDDLVSDFRSVKVDGTQQLTSKDTPEHDYYGLLYSSLVAVYIVSLGLSSRASVEMTMSQILQGHHDTPDILKLGDITVPRPTRIFSDLKDIQACNGYYRMRNVGCPIRNYLITSTKGESLIGAEPYDIARAAVDGIIGHLNLFLLGYLHQNVSCDNVLKMPEVVQLSRDDIQKTNICFSHPNLQKIGKFDFLMEHMNERLGFIVDDDEAVEWRKGREAGRHRSGTMPFISSRIIRGWAYDKFTLFTAIDDLESFAWMVLWCALHKLKNPTMLEAFWIEFLSSNTFRRVLYGKSSILDELSKELTRDTSTFSKPLMLLLPLVSKWLSVAQKATDRLDTFLLAFVKISQYETLEDVIADSVFANERNGFYEQLEDLCIDVYAEYLQAGVEFLKSSNEQPTMKPAA